MEEWNALAPYLARLDSEFIQCSVMRPDSRWRDVPCLRDVALRYPLSLFFPRLVETGRCDPGRMDARRNAVLLGLLRERLGTLSDFVRELETLVRARVCLDVLSKAVSWISLVAIVLIVIREFANAHPDTL